MKKRAVTILILIFILSVFFALPAAAASDDPMSALDYRFPSSYTKLTRGNLSRNSNLVKKLGFTPSDLKKYMQAEDIYIIAAGEDAKGEFHIKCTETEFSKKMTTFSGLNSEALTRINSTLFGGNAEACTIGKSDTVYFRTKSKVQSANFYTYQYATVENGKLYSFVYYGNSEQEIDEFMKTLKIKKTSNVSPSVVATGILIAVVIIGCLVAMGIIAVTVVRDIKKPAEEETEETEQIKIKRRKM